MASPTLLGECSARLYNTSGISSPLTLPVTFDLPQAGSVATMGLLLIYAAPFEPSLPWPVFDISDDQGGASPNAYAAIPPGDGNHGWDGMHDISNAVVSTAEFGSVTTFPFQAFVLVEAYLVDLTEGLPNGSNISIAFTTPGDSSARYLRAVLFGFSNAETAIPCVAARSWDGADFHNSAGVLRLDSFLFSSVGADLASHQFVLTTGAADPPFDGTESIEQLGTPWTAADSDEATDTDTYSGGLTVAEWTADGATVDSSQPMIGGQFQTSDGYIGFQDDATLGAAVMAIAFRISFVAPLITAPAFNIVVPR